MPIIEGAAPIKTNIRHKHQTPNQTQTQNRSDESTSAVMVGIKNAVASGLATAVSKSMLAPFDTLKTVQQNHQLAGQLTLFEAFQQVTSRKGGYGQLYSGLGVAVIGSMPSVGLYFGVYAYCKRTIGPMFQKQESSTSTSTSTPLVAVAISAAIGNTVASFSRVPYEVVKQKLQAGVYDNTFTALSSMWRENGMRTFFPLGGISSQMVRDIPYAIFTLMSYEWLRENWVCKNSNNNSNHWRNMAAGAIAGGIGSFLTNPMDVIKTRLQTNVPGELVKYTGVMGCARVTLANEGPSAFLKGVAPRLAHKIPANAFFFLSFELFRRLLNVDQVTQFEAQSDEADCSKAGKKIKK